MNFQALFNKGMWLEHQEYFFGNSVIGTIDPDFDFFIH